ncbi:MAG: Rieske 2Fe-2S domain-containing protein [Deltaproteobacteria bacterium]|nr:Rieske 2Fe-2S domain-containing protein [Deltaproteobacteria bacterium]
MDFYYTGPDTLAGRYLRKFWHPVYRAQDIPPGWAKPIKIMGEQFTLYRGDGGKPHLVDFRCPHRQAQLSIGWIEDDSIRCRFHGWRFDATGQCVEQPAEKESFAEKIRIRSCPTEEYLGLIFVYFGDGAPPPLPRYPDFEKAGLWVETYVRPCNFLNNIENDPVHISSTHRESEFFLRRPHRQARPPAQRTRRSRTARRDSHPGLGRRRQSQYRLDPRLRRAGRPGAVSVAQEGKSRPLRRAANFTAQNLAARAASARRRQTAHAMESFGRAAAADFPLPYAR